MVVVTTHATAGPGLVRASLVAAPRSSSVGSVRRPPCGSVRLASIIESSLSCRCGRPSRRASGLARAGGRYVVRVADVSDLEELEMEVMERMDKALDKLDENLMTVRTGRASAGLLEPVKVDYYGALTPLKSLASVTTPDASTINVQPFDKSALGDIEKAITDADLGVNPMNDGNVVRINIPQLTAERRKEMVKRVSKMGEESKVAVRNIRRDAMKTLDKYEKGGLSEDMCKDKSADIQKLTDDSIKKIDDAAKKKEKELTQV